MAKHAPGTWDVTEDGGRGTIRSYEHTGVAAAALLRAADARGLQRRETRTTRPAAATPGSHPPRVPAIPLRRAWLLLAVPLVAACGTSTQKPTTAAPPPATQVTVQPANGPIGSTASDGDLAVTVSNMRIVTAASGAPQGIPAPEHGQYVAVTTHIANTGTAQEMTGPGVFYLQTADGQRWDSVIADVAFDPQLQPAAAVAGGDQVTGTVVWDVPATHGKIVYQPHYAPVYSWTF